VIRGPQTLRAVVLFPKVGSILSSLEAANGDADD
jgi:hypothetical protein